MPFKWHKDEYTLEEIKAISKEFIRLNMENAYKDGFGICWTRKIHKLFHKLYGYEDFGLVELEEFIEKWNRGELKV